MTSPILKALASGYSADLIVKMLIKQFPQHSAKIQQAVNMGFGPDKILKFLTGGRKSLANEEGSLTEHEESSNLDAQRRSNVNKAALGIAGAGVAGLGALALGSRIPQAMQALGGAAPQMPPTQPQPPPQGPTPLQQGMQQQAIQRAIPNAGIPQSTQQIATQAAQQPQTPIPSPAQPAPIVPQVKPALQLVQEANLIPHIQALQKNIQDPKQIAGVLFTQFPKEMQKLQQEAGKPMEEVIAEAMQGMPQSQLPIEQPIAEVPQQPIEEIKPVEPVKLEKGSKVVTPDGDIGEISKLSGNTAQIETENGKKGAKLDKIEAITPEVNDVLENYKRLINSIPEEHKSAVVNFIGYDPDRKKLSVRFHNGDQYNYEDLDEEDVTKIADAFHLAKTSGENMYGAWSPDDPSRGAGLHKLIMELQKKYGGKGKEYSAKFKTLYDYLALPKQLLAEEEKRKKDEERARKAKAKQSKS